MAVKEAKDYTEKATRKAIPKTTQAWLAEVGGTTKFVEQKPKMKEASGAAWLASMQAYYVARLDLLLKHIPPGLSKKTAHAIVKEVRAKLV